MKSKNKPAMTVAEREHVAPSRELVGQRFGRWLVIGVPPQRVKPNGRADPRRLVCQCDCGSPPVDVNQTSLTRGASKSCGCLRKERLRELHTTHGMAETRVYRIWTGMHTRCYNAACKGFPNYGGRGIEICERWHSFEYFYADMGDPPPRHSIDRYPNNDGNYEPDNCRWATAVEQQANRRAKARNFGTDTYNAKLTEPIVAQIILRRRNGEPTRALAKEHGVAHSLIERIVTGKSWRHVYKAMTE